MITNDSSSSSFDDNNNDGGGQRRDDELLRTLLERAGCVDLRPVVHPARPTPRRPMHAVTHPVAVGVHARNTARC